MKNKTKLSTKNIFFTVIILGVIVSLLFLFLFPGKPKRKKADNSIPPLYVNAEPKFKKEGELNFQSNDSKAIKAKFDIEIADNDESRMQGLMYRKSMAENQAMLFLFDYCSPQSFWMKNTHISLDIIYVNDKFEVVSIQKNTIPFSEASLPSFKPAQYVIEVNAGLSDKLGICEGDKVKW
jgi:uncharacterized membrane protein (UPF0127 family)